MDNKFNNDFDTLRIKLLDMYIDETANHHLLWKESSEKGKFYAGTDEILIVFGKEKADEDVYEMKFVNKDTLESRYLLKNINKEDGAFFEKSNKLYETILQCQKQEDLNFFKNFLKK